MLGVLSTVPQALEALPQDTRQDLQGKIKYTCILLLNVLASNKQTETRVENIFPFSWGWGGGGHRGYS